MDMDNKEQSLPSPTLSASQATASSSGPSTPAFQSLEPPGAPRDDQMDESGNFGTGISIGEEERPAGEAHNHSDEMVTEGIMIDPWFEDLEAYDKGEGAAFVEPTTEERFFWTDPITTIKREIWRPGDGDGDRMTDYHDRPGAPPPLEDRWRFYQSRTGSGSVKRGKSEPPKYVILDDRATQEVLVSDIPRTNIAKFWPHDFGTNGTIRARRSHRGRGGIGDFEASGQDRFHFANIPGRKNGERYYFSGEPDYIPVIWSTSDYHLAMGVFKPEIKKIASPPKKKELKWNQHGHNQHTPTNELVKFGAPRKGNSYKRWKDRASDLEGGPRGGRNRVQPTVNAASGASSPAPSPKHEQVERWRNDTRGTTRSERGSILSERESSFVSPSYEGREGAKRRRIDAAAAFHLAERKGKGADDAYVTYVETCLVESKVVTDAQQAEIERLQRELTAARMRIMVLQTEAERRSGDEEE